MAWIAVILYGVAIIIIGVKAYSHHETDDSYWTAGRSLGAWSVGLSLSAGFMSISWSCVYAVQIFYWYGVGGVWLITIPWLISLWLIYIVSQKYHALPAFSQPEMVGNRFGSAARKMIAIPLIFVFLVWGGAEIFVAAQLLAPELGVSLTGLVVAIGVLVGFYMTLGGFRAVVATDKLQYILVAVYILAITCLAIIGLMEHDGPFFPWPHTTAAKTSGSWLNLISPGLVIILLTMAAYLPGWVFEADLWLRIQAAKDNRAARKGVLIGGVNALVFVGILPLFIGISAINLYPADGPATQTDIGFEGDAIFAALVSDFAPAWLKLVIILGLVAAAMSTIDTCLNVMGLSISYDLLSDRPGLQKASARKWVTAGTVTVAVLFALRIQSLWDIFYLSSGILTTSVALPVAAVFWKRTRRRAVFMSSLFGFTGTILAYFLESRGLLNFIEPMWLVESYLGFILWGILAAAVGFRLGAFLDSRNENQVS